uniref:Tuftelin-interacting protein 11 n=1 Tax=Cacopsylla melanoneura TaxID=428564 RepID=A0A8D8YMB8_9HEMI
MSDGEYERFEVTDYDLNNEFNTNRPRKKMSKNQMIYGMWADSDNEDEDAGRPSFSKKKPKNYTAPVNFISGGVQQAGKKKDEEEQKENDQSDDEERRQIEQAQDSSDEDMRPSFGKKTSAMIDGDIAGLRKKSQTAPVSSTLSNKGVGNWEKHTKGIGAKLLLQMGYQPGKGLGKGLQGIAAPIEAKLRKGRGAIGAYGPETKQKVADIGDKEVKQKSIRGKEEVKVSHWRKEGKEKSNVQYVYKSIEDVIEESKHGVKKQQPVYNELAKVKVIDMTGPEQRVLSGYHAICGVQKPSDQWELRKDKKFANFAVPELMHNINLIVDMCEQNIIDTDKKLQYIDNRTVHIEQEVNNLETLCIQEETTIDQLEKILAIIDSMTMSSEHKTLTLEETAKTFKQLKEQHFAEYCMYDLSSLAVSLLKPIFKDILSAWSPLEDARKPISLFQEWKSILEIEQVHSLSTISGSDPYQRIVWDALMPSFRIAASTWNCKKQAEPMLRLIEAWKPLLPTWMIANILQQEILPKLLTEVEEWNPLTDTIPIHSWVLPWVPLLGQYFTTVIYPTIRHKLSSALVNWHPSDSSARLLLLPWTNVFSRGETDAFLLHNIVPKLHNALQEYVINPQQQHLDNWNWVMEWSELLSSQTMASILNTSFFPKWLQVLSMWLNMNPNYDQVANWYQGWKSLFTENLLQEPVIKEHFRYALDMMSRSVGAGGGDSVLPPPPPPPPLSPPSGSGSSSKHGFAESVSASKAVPQGFRDLLQKSCEERGILFMPLANRYREGKPVYKCGEVQVYIDRSVIFVSVQNGPWTPKSISDTVKLAAG